MTYDIEREIVLTRVFDAPRRAVWDAWTGDAISEWFGPEGFVCTTKERDVRVGGVWRFDLVAPDGTVFPNRIDYLEITPESKLVMEHGDDGANDVDAFLVTITFDEQQDGKTVLMMRQLQPSKAQRDATIGFGAVELGYQTLDKLAKRLAV
jgi:uncharacterized protein YndB with AHSA1/START domain